MKIRWLRRSSDHKGACPTIRPLKPSSHQTVDALPSSNGSVGRGYRQLSLSGQCSINTDRTAPQSPADRQSTSLGGNYYQLCSTRELNPGSLSALHGGNPLLQRRLVPVCDPRREADLCSSSAGASSAPSCRPRRPVQLWLGICIIR